MHICLDCKQLKSVDGTMQGYARKKKTFTQPSSELLDGVKI